LMAAPFDTKTLRVTGPPAVVQNGTTSAIPIMDLSVATDTSLIYASGSNEQGPHNLAWVDRTGHHLAILTGGPLDTPRFPRISPDGHRLAISLGPTPTSQIWIYDLTSTRQPLKLTVKTHNVHPSWSPDGNRLAFESTLQGQRNLFLLPADGSTLEPERLTMSSNEQGLPSWSPDGRWLLFRE